MEGNSTTKTLVMPFSDVIKLLRIPFSFFLLPVYLFAWISVKNPEWINFIFLFILLHFFIYPASNAYNSYMDQDKESIGGLENPPPAGKETFYVSIALDLIAFTCAFFLSVPLAMMIIVYSVISRLYSWRKTRIKKYPWLSLLTVSIIQGGFTFMTASMFMSNGFKLSWFNENQNLFGFTATSFLVAAFYPLTQIYQHEADRMNGDRTVSYVVGIKGTFILSGIFFLMAFFSMFGYFNSIRKSELFGIFLIFILPAIIYFKKWASRCFRNYKNADFKSMMKMNIISSSLIIVVFLIIRLLY